MAGKKRRTKKDIRTRLSVLAAALFVLFIVFFQAARFLDSAAGRVFLLDIGFDSKYSAVQGEIHDRIIRVLLENGVKRSNLEIFPMEDGDGYRVSAPLPANRSLIRLNASLDRAVEDIGARVRSCREMDSGQTLDMKIGTDRRLTHRCLIKKTRNVSSANSRIAVVVDDFGYSSEGVAADFLELEAGITLSVIPGLKYSGDICEKAADAGRSFICHMPMEPEEGECSTDYCVRVSMTDAQIREAVSGAVQAIPGAAGMNNHMGSRATADPRVMAAVLRVCRERGLFFLDSLTSPNSVAAETARRLGLRVLVNDIFLDNRGADIRGNMLKLMRKSERRGYAIGIMHVHRKSFRELKWMIEEAEKRGIELVTLEDLIKLIAGKEA